MVSLDPEISNLLWVQVSSEVPSGPGCAATFANVLKEKWKTLDIQNGSKNRINNSTFFGINSLFLLSFSFTGFYRLIEFKDNLRTIEPRFPKNLRTNEARSDFTAPYKKSVFHRLSIVSNEMALRDFGSI